MSDTNSKDSSWTTESFIVVFSSLVCWKAIISWASHSPILQLCACYWSKGFSVYFSLNFACIGKQAIKLCQWFYFWPILLPIFIPCLILFRFNYCFLETLLLIIPVDKLCFLLHKTFSSIIWDDMCLSLNGYRQEIQCQDLYWESHYFYFFSVATIISFPFPVQACFRSVCKSQYYQARFKPEKYF